MCTPNVLNIPQYICHNNNWQINSFLKKKTNFKMH